MLSRRLTLITAVIIAGGLCFGFLQQDILCRDNPALIWKNTPEKIAVDDNGSTKFSCIFHRDVTSAITVCRFFIKGGKKAEPENRKGLAFITTRLCIELQAYSDIRELQELGSSFSMQVEGDYSIITARCLSENLEDTLKMLTTILAKPLVSSLRISHVKKNMEHRQKSEEDDDYELMNREYYNIFFGKEGYGGSVFGDKDSLKQLKKKDITGFHKKYFNLSNMVITISSDLPKEEITDILKKHVGSLPKGEIQLSASPVQKQGEAGKKENFFKKQQTQSLISLAVRLPEMTPHNFTCAYILETLLGEGIGSRLWPIREEKKLAYRLQARVTQMKDAGILIVHLKTGNSKKENALAALKEVLTDLYEKGTTETEFSAVKTLSRACFLRNNETKDMRTFNLGIFETAGPGFEFLEDFFSHLERMQAADFNTYIKDVLKPGNLVKITIGPGDNES
jgi:predicted Zn-dependent peptidase